MTSRYKITPESRIALYGYNTYTRKQIQWLTSWGCTELYVIDRNADKIGKIEGAKIVPDIGRINGSAEICVWIMLQNAMQHADIAQTLYQQGVRKALFVPMIRNLQNRDFQMEMTMLYNWMFLGRYEMLNQIPILEEQQFQTCREQICDVITAGREEAVVWIPVPALHAISTAQAGYGDVPIVAFQPYYDLLSCLRGRNTEIDTYIANFVVGNDNEITEEIRARVLTDRKRLVDYMDSECNRGADFFVAAAPQAVWNPKGFFNLCEGHHRCTFLIDRNWKKLPVRLKVSDIELAGSYYPEYSLNEEEYQYTVWVQSYFEKRNVWDSRHIECSDEIRPTVRKLCGVRDGCGTDIYMGMSGMCRNGEEIIEKWIERCCETGISEIIILDERQRIQNKLQEKGVLNSCKNLGGLLKDGKRLELCVYTLKKI